MAFDVERDPVTGGRIGKGHAVVKAQLGQVRQALEQQGEVDLKFDHCSLGLQRGQAFPGPAQAVEPEHRGREAGFKLKQQVGVLTAVEALLVALELVCRGAAQGGDAFTVGIRIARQRQPGHGAAQAQGTQVGGTLAQPPGAERSGLILQVTQPFMRRFFAVDCDFRREQLGSGVLELGNHRTHCAGLRRRVCRPLQMLRQLPTSRQQQRCVIPQVRRPEFIELREVFKDGLE